MSDDAALPETPSDADAPTHDAAPPQQEPGTQQPYQAATRSSPWGYCFFLGLVLLISGFFWKWVEQEDTTILDVWIFAGLVCTLAPFFWHLVDIFALIRSRRAAASGFVVITTVLGLLALGIVTYLNVKKGRGSWMYDSTATGKYTLGEETEKLLDSLEGTVYVTYLEHARTDPGLREAAEDQVDMYAAVSDHVKFQVLQPLRNRDRAAAYLRDVGVGSTSSGESDDVIVLSYSEAGKQPVPGRHKEVRVETYTWLKANQLGETKWLGERLLSDAILELVFRRYKLYATGGHGERTPAEEMRSLREALQGQNIELVDRPLDLRANPRLPDDCDVLAIFDPRVPFAPEEASAISDYLDRGRTLFLSFDVAERRTESGLENVLDRHGIYPHLNYRVIAPMPVAFGVQKAVYEPSDTLVIRPTDYADHPSVAALRAKAGLATAFRGSTYLDVAEDPADGLDVRGVVFAPFVEGLDPPGFAVRVDPSRRDYTAPDAAIDKVGGHLALVALATRQVQTAPGEPPRDARVIVLGDTDVLTDAMIAQVAPNRDLAVGLLQWGIRREGLVAVSERTIEDDRVKLEPSGQRLALAWPLAVALMTLLCGGLVWWTRRR